MMNHICPKCEYEDETINMFDTCRKCNYSSSLICRPSTYKTRQGFLIWEVLMRDGWRNINLIDFDKKLFRDEPLPKFTVQQIIDKFTK